MNHLRGVSGPSRRLRPLALLVVLALVLAACGGGREDEKESEDTTAQPTGDGTTETTAGAEPIIDASACPSDPTTGIEGDTIKLGISLPQSGLYSAFAEILRGSKAYFTYVNDELGGVEVAGQKYKIELLDKDDAYEADRTSTNVQELINDDGVFALFNVVGTKNNLAVRDIVNEMCVPNLFAATGSPAWGNADYPWLLGTGLVPYPLEAKAFFDYLSENMPQAKIAILRAADDFGRAYSETLAGLIEGTEMEIVKEETYNAEQFDTKSQMTSLAATDADVFFLGATLLGCTDALNNMAAAGWAPVVYMSGTCTSKTIIGGAAPEAADGVITVQPILDPADPANDSVEAMKLYKEQVAKSPASSASAPDPTTNGVVAYGWTTAALLVELLGRAPALDRVSVMETARNFTDVEGVELMLDGAVWNTNVDDWFLAESFRLVQYSVDKGYFEPISDLIVEDGNTAEYAPAELVTG